jgi:hypothetical protein
MVSWASTEKFGWVVIGYHQHCKLGDGEILESPDEDYNVKWARFSTFLNPHGDNTLVACVEMDNLQMAAYNPAKNYITYVRRC